MPLQRPPKGIFVALNESSVDWAPLLGAVAQLVAHLHGMQGVRGSSPLSSTLLTCGAADYNHVREGSTRAAVANPVAKASVP